MLNDCTDCGGKWGSHYSTCAIAADSFVKELDRWSRATADDDPRCPSCGFATTDWHEFAGRYVGDGDSFTVMCEHCEREYKVELVVRHSFRVERR